MRIGSEHQNQHVLGGIAAFIHGCVLLTVHFQCQQVQPNNALEATCEDARASAPTLGASKLAGIKRSWRWLTP